MAKSILQDNPHECYLCRRTAGPFDKHHIFSGSLRKKSEKYGLTVWLCHNSCHIFGPNSAHQSGETALYLHRQAQRAAMGKYGWTAADFMREFGKNYL